MCTFPVFKNLVLKNYSVKRYQESDYANWNTFVNQAKNATFLFHRDFIEYHKDRFDDYSLLVFESENLVAILPANRVVETVYSHQGLTYGGLVYKENLKLASVIQIFKTILYYLYTNEINKIQLKTIPSIYHKKPAEELNYVLFLSEAILIRRDTLAVIDLSKPFEFSKIRKRGIQKGIDNNLIIKEDNNFESFWNKVLIPNLESKHNVKPVHTLAEIELLKGFLNKNIRQFNVYYNDKIVAGTTVFESENVAHCQYISKYEDDENLGSLDFLYNHLIKEVFVNKRYFDFGISNEGQGKILNNGLSYWKESFGANTIVHDFYEVATSHFTKFENVIK